MPIVILVASGAIILIALQSDMSADRQVG